MTTRDVGAASSSAMQAALEAELQRAEEAFACDDFGEFTVDELDRRALAGEWPWSSRPAD